MGFAGQTINLSERIISYKLDVRSSVIVAEKDRPEGIFNTDLYQHDIIVGLNENPIQSVEDLHRLLDENMIGKVIDLYVLRNNINLSSIKGKGKQFGRNKVSCLDNHLIVNYIHLQNLISYERLN